MIISRQRVKCEPLQQGQYSDSQRPEMFVVRPLYWRDFPHSSRPTLGSIQPPVKWFPCLTWGKAARGVALNTYPNLAPCLKNKWSYTSTPPLGLYGLLCGGEQNFLSQRRCEWICLFKDINASLINVPTPSSKQSYLKVIWKREETCPLKIARTNLIWNKMRNIQKDSLYVRAIW